MQDVDASRERAALNHARGISRCPYLPKASGESGTEKNLHRPGVTSDAMRGQESETLDSPYRRRLAEPAAAPICARMSASNPSSGGTLDARFLRAVEAWCARSFGTVACRDHGFVATWTLAKRRSGSGLPRPCWPATGSPGRVPATFESGAASATGETLEGVGAIQRKASIRAIAAEGRAGQRSERGIGDDVGKGRDEATAPATVPEPQERDRGK